MVVHTSGCAWGAQREEGNVEARGGAVRGSLAKRESDMVVKYSPQPLKSKEGPITGVLFYEGSVHASIRSLMSSLLFPRLSFGLTIRCPKRLALGTQRAVAISPTGKAESAQRKRGSLMGYSAAGVGAPCLAKDGGFGL